MTQAAPYQASFNAGEFSERMVARTQFERYASAVEIMENMIPLAQGGAMRRSGTRFVAEAKNSLQTVRLKSFQFSTLQAYILEMGEKYMRFYRNQGRFVLPTSDAAITNGTFDSDISGWTDQSTGTADITHDNTNNRLDLNAKSGSGNDSIAEQSVSVSSDFLGETHLLKLRVLSANPADFVTLRIGTSSGASDILEDTTLGVGFHARSFMPLSDPFFIQIEHSDVDDNTVQIDDVSIVQNAPAEMDTPYQASEVFTVMGPQSADVLYNFHNNHRPHKLLRFGDIDWSLEAVAWNDGPYLAVNTDSTKTIAPSATTGRNITLTASGHSPFSSTDVGRLVRIKHSSTWGSAIIVSVESGHSATADVQNSFGGTSQSSDWRMGAWSDTTGWPAVGVFFEERLTVGRSDSQPQTIWLSQTDDFENMRPDDGTGTVADDDALSLTIASDQVDAIRWLASSQRGLLIGTVGGEWIMGSDGPVVTPTDFEIRRQTAHGSADVEPVSVANVAIYLQRARRKIRESRFVFESDAFESVDLTRLSDHITRSGVTQMAYAQEPNSLIWAVRNDGELAAMTFLREESIVGWSRQIFGGSFGTGNAVCESVAVIPGATATNSENRDETWVIVKRTIDGKTKKYIEFLEADFEEGDDEADAFYVDSGLTFEGSTETEIEGLDHLEGETVKVWGNAAIEPSQKVSDGKINLDSAVTKAQIGLGYTHKLKTLKLDIGAQLGTAVGKTKRIDGLTLVLLHAHKINVGPQSADTDAIDFRTVSDPMDSGVPFFSGEHFVEFAGEFDSDPRIVMEGDEPTPAVLLALAPQMETMER